MTVKIVYTSLSTLELKIIEIHKVSKGFTEFWSNLRKEFGEDIPVSIDTPLGVMNVRFPLTPENLHQIFKECMRDHSISWSSLDRTTDPSTKVVEPVTLKDLNPRDRLIQLIDWDDSITISEPGICTDPKRRKEHEEMIRRQWENGTCEESQFSKLARTKRHESK